MDYHIFTDWLTSLGTIGAVVIAVLSRPIRNWWNRPRIDITCSNKEPCVVQIGGTSSNSDTDKRLVMRIKVTNTGNYNATYSALYVDSFYQKRRDGKYIQKEFTPKQLRDYKNSTPSVIASHLVYYFDIATLLRFDIQTNENGTVKAKQFYKLYLLGDGKTTELGTGSFIIPVKFYCSNSCSVVKYISVFWDGVDLSKESSVFDFKIINEKEFEELTKR